MWYYKSAVGIMKIYKNNYGRYSLQIGDTVYGCYDTAVGAADDVRAFVTGCDKWDSLDDTVEPPSDIYEWEKR